MSDPKILENKFIDSYDSDDSDYIPSQTPESEDYTSYESSSLETESESEYSITCSEDCSDITDITGSSDLSSFGSSQYSLE